MRRLALLAAAAAAVAVLSGGCSSTLDYAAKVNGAIISRTSIDNDLADIASNAKYVQDIKSQGSGAPVVQGPTPGTYGKVFTDDVLTESIQAEVIHQELVRRRALPTAAQVGQARTEVVQEFTQAIFGAFPKRYQDLVVRQRADADVFVAKVGGPLDVSQATIQAYYESHKDSFLSEECVRHILIADKGSNGNVDYPTSLAHANRIRAQLESGASFATLAKADSQDNGAGGSASAGGQLTGSAPDGCLSAQDLQQLVQPFATAAEALPVNQISQPVQTQFGYHLIEVTSKTIEPLDATVTASIRQTLAQPNTAAATKKLTQLLRVAKVTVNPEFGTFDPTGAHTNGQGPGVIPPKAPSAGSAASTTTTVAGG